MTMNAPDRNGPNGFVRAEKAERGFSLIEVLVSLTIIGISLIVLLQIFSGGLQRITRLEETYQASIFARSLAARVGRDLPLETGLQTGENDQGFKWVIDILPYDTDYGLVRVTTARGELYEVTVRVTWKSSVREREVVLNSLRYEGTVVQ